MGAGKNSGSIHSFKNIRQNAPRRARKNGGGRCGPCPRKPGPSSPSPAGGNGALRAANANRPAAARPLPLPGPPLLPSSSRLVLPGRAGPRRGHRGRTKARGFSSSRPPPGPRPLPGRRGSQSGGGSTPSAFGASKPPDPPQSLGRERGEGAEELQGATQPTCGPGPRHWGDKDTRNHQSRCCRRHRKRLSGSATTGRKLPLSRIWSLPRLHRRLPSPTPACHPTATVERKCAFPDRMHDRQPRLGGVLV